MLPPLKQIVETQEKSSFWVDTKFQNSISLILKQEELFERVTSDSLNTFLPVTDPSGSDSRSPLVVTDVMVSCSPQNVTELPNYGNDDIFADDDDGAAAASTATPYDFLTGDEPTGDNTAEPNHKIQHQTHRNDQLTKPTQSLQQWLHKSIFQWWLPATPTTTTNRWIEEDELQLLELYTIITGEYDPLPHIDFTNIVSNTLSTKGGVFLEESKPKKNACWLLWSFTGSKNGIAKRYRSSCRLMMMMITTSRYHCHSVWLLPRHNHVRP